MTRTGKHDPLLYGRDETEGIVAVEYLAKKEGADEVALFLRRGDETTTETAVFEPFLIAGDRVIEGCPVDHRVDRLKGRGRLNTMAFFASWGECTEARRWLGRETGFSATAPGAPYLCINDPVQQYLMQTGRTLFLGMDYEELRRMQLDIECETTEGYDFCNAEREGDRIVAVGMSDSTGWEQVLSVADMNEKEMLSALVESITERDPDVLEGHNIFNFDLPYIATRARMHKVKLALGRDGSAPRRRPSRMSVGERTLSYSRFDVWGRHIVDTLFLVHAYDISHRSLDGFGLKEAAIHFGLTGATFAICELSISGLLCIRMALLGINGEGFEVVLAGVCDVGNRPPFTVANEALCGALFFVIEKTSGRDCFEYGKLSLDQKGNLEFNGAEVRNLVGLAQDCMAVSTGSVNKQRIDQ